jgi:hypothetical protein
MKRTAAIKRSTRRASRPEAAPSQDIWISRLLRLALAVAAASGIICSAKLWVSSHRLFPLTPVGGLPQLPFPLDYVLAGMALAALAAVAIARRPALFIKVFLGLMSALALLDQSRWQPWVLQYSVMFGALLLLPRTAEEAKWTAAPVAATLHACRLFMVCTYFYSGLEKLGYGFVTVLPEMFAPVFHLLRINVANLSDRTLLPLAILLGLVECGSGVMLAFRRTRNSAVICLILMHLAILSWLGPWGTNWNYVVWPWNVLMIGLLILLFWRKPTWGLQDVWRSHRYARAVGLAFGVLPLLTLVGLWDSYLGFSLYTGNIKRAVLYIDPKRLPDLPAAIRRFTMPDGVIDIDRWCYTEFGVPIYPETRIFVSAGRQVALWLGPGARVQVIELGRPNPLTGQRDTTTIDPLKY